MEQYLQENQDGKLKDIALKAEVISCIRNAKGNPFRIESMTLKQHFIFRKAVGSQCLKQTIYSLGWGRERKKNEGGSERTNEKRNVFQKGQCSRPCLKEQEGQIDRQSKQTRRNFQFRS